MRREADRPSSHEGPPAALARMDQGRLETVLGTGRRLVSCLDHWSIMRTLRADLAQHIDFDVFILATVAAGPRGLVAQGHAYDSGQERWVPPVPLSRTGPAKEAYQTGRTVLIRRSRWARSVDASRPAEPGWLLRDGAAVFVTRPAGTRQATRSVLWAPVLTDRGVEGLLSVQSYAADALDEDDAALIDALSPYVALALTNAGHFASAQSRMRALEALAAIGEIDTTAPAGARLQLASEVERALATWNGSLWLLDAERLVRQPQPGPGEEVAVAWPGAGRARSGDASVAMRRVARVCLSAAGSPEAVPVNTTGRVAGVIVADLAGAQPAEGLRLMHALAGQAGVVLERLESVEERELMLRAIGHELRSPAAAMRGTLASLLEWEGALDEDRRHLLLREAYDSSERLLGLVEAQLLIARLEAPGYRPRPRRVDVARVAEEVVEVLRHRFPAAAAVELRFPAGLPPALCERVHLSQVLTNLVANALEHGRAPVRVSGAARRGALEVTVSDGGTGPRAELRRGLLRGAGGGLGLRVCRVVVEKSFRGRLWRVESGPGASFLFTLPRTG